MFKKMNFLQAESTLTEFSIELMVLKLLQNNAEMSHMLCHTPFQERGNEASVRVPRMFKSHV
jgi:hypothetical protein